MTAAGRVRPLLLALAMIVASAAPVAASAAPAAASAAPVVAPADVVFDRPRAEGTFGQTVTFSTTFRAAEPPRRVELLSWLPDDEATTVEIVAAEPLGDGRWSASAIRGGHIVPNTRWHYRFRVITPEGTVEGPTGSYRHVDERVSWRTLAGDHVNVWWHEGDETFGERALAIAEDALASASELLGVEDIEPVDFFIYADTRQFRQAMGPATRENVGGQAHLGIRTLFGLIGPRQIDSDWVDELVAHELAHLVFHEAVDNPYQYPPRWLNEGVAVYLSRGHTRADEAQVRGAAGSGTIIPLEGLGGNFPTRVVRSSLAYAEGVSAVNYFVETYGQDQLVELISAFGEGSGLDEAFTVATGADFAAFESAWLASLDGQRPEPYGPRPVEPGPTPDAWAAEASALLR